MVTLLFWILSGMLVGCFVNRLMARFYEDEPPGAAQNVFTGALGAALGGSSYARQFSPDALSPVTVLTALAGAALLIALSAVAKARIA